MIKFSVFHKIVANMSQTCRLWILSEIAENLLFWLTKLGETTWRRVNTTNRSCRKSWTICPLVFPARNENHLTLSRYEKKNVRDWKITFFGACFENSGWRLLSELLRLQSELQRLLSHKRTQTTTLNTNAMLGMNLVIIFVYLFISFCCRRDVQTTDAHHAATSSLIGAHPVCSGYSFHIII